MGEWSTAASGNTSAYRTWAGLNGAGLNGAGLNGAGLNGAGLNGAGLNGAGLNGAGLERAWANVQLARERSSEGGVVVAVALASHWH